MTRKKQKDQKPTNNAKRALFKNHPAPRPVLRFSPTAWAKLLFFRDLGATEVGGFAVTAAHDLLYVEEFVTVKQQASFASVDYDGEAVADFFEEQVAAGRSPEQFARIWLHTHPGSSSEPSLTDEETFTRVFGGCQWAVIFVLAKDGGTHARLRFNVGPGGETKIPVRTDFRPPFCASEHREWEAEYRANVETCSIGPIRTYLFDDDKARGLGDLCVTDEWMEEFEAMEPAERQFILA